MTTDIDKPGVYDYGWPTWCYDCEQIAGQQVEADRHCDDCEQPVCKECYYALHGEFYCTI